MTKPNPPNVATGFRTAGLGGGQETGDRGQTTEDGRQGMTGEVGNRTLFKTQNPKPKTQNPKPYFT